MLCAFATIQQQMTQLSPSPRTNHHPAVEQGHIGSRQRITTPGRRSWRHRGLRDTDYECDARYAGYAKAPQQFWITTLG
jgi:hypothetical protein